MRETSVAKCQLYMGLGGPVSVMENVGGIRVCHGLASIVVVDFILLAKARESQSGVTHLFTRDRGSS